MHFTTDRPMTMIKAPSISIQTLEKMIQRATTMTRQASQLRITKGSIGPGRQNKVLEKLYMTMTAVMKRQLPEVVGFTNRISFIYI